MIKTFNHVHSCKVVADKNNQADRDWVAGILKDQMKVDPKIKLGSAMNFIKSKFGVDVSESTVCRALRKARKNSTV